MVFIVVLETGQFHVVLAFYVSKTKFARMHILNNSAALLTFLNGMKTLMGFIRQHAGFCQTQKLKLPSLVISRPVRFLCVQNTSSSDVHGRPTWEAWAPQLECLGARRAPWNFYSGNQLWGLGALTKMLGSPKGSLKFSLERSLDKCTSSSHTDHMATKTHTQMTKGLKNLSVQRGLPAGKKLSC